MFFPAYDVSVWSAQGVTSGPAAHTVTLDATGERMSMIFMAPKTGTLESVKVRTATVTTGDDVRFSFQNVSGSDQFPDGTIDQYRTVTIGDGDDDTIIDSGIISSNGTDGGTKRSVTQGELVCLVLDYPSYVAGNLSFSVRRTVPSLDHAAGGQYFVSFYDGAVWSNPTVRNSRFTVKYDDGSYAYIPGVCPYVGDIAEESFANNSTPDERGNIIKPYNEIRVIGIYGWVEADGAFDFVLYDTDGSTALDSVSADNIVRTIGGPHIWFAMFDGSQVLTKDGSYRAVIKPTNTTASSAFVGTVGSAAEMDQASGGQRIHSTTRTDAGSWTEVTTKRYLIGVITDPTYVPAGGGASKLVGGGLVG